MSKAVTPRNLLDVTDLDADEVGAVLDLARRDPAELGRPLDGRGVALIFEKPSTRTRHSTEIAVVQLGGHPVYTRGEEMGIDTREPAEDVVRILQGYHAVIAARVFDHEVLLRMAAVADVPIVNLLSDRAHPLQAIADALTMEEELGSLKGRRVAWVGDYNNVARSLAEISTMLGADVSLACPPGFAPDEAELERLDLGRQRRGAAPSSAGRRRRRRRRRALRHLGVDGPGRREGAAAAGVRGVHRRRRVDGVGGSRRRVHALPAGVPRAGSDRQRDRRAAQPGDPPGPQPPPRGACRPRLPRRGAPVSVKQRRQQAIVRLIGQQPVGNQPRLLELLAHEGVRTTQATVSRDLDELGVIKVRAAGGQTVYALPAIETDRIAPSEQLRRVLGEWVADVGVSGNIVIVRTPPGCAHVVASALDRSAIGGLLGTVAGDDTLMCVAAAGTEGERLAADLRELAGFERRSER